MKRPYIASLGLGATLLVAAVSVATATYVHTPDLSAHAASVCKMSEAGGSAAKSVAGPGLLAKASKPSTRLTAQVPMSPYCYTNVVPPCQMPYFLPVGAACWCPSAIGPIGGVVR